jgi:IS1 family transposase
LTIQVDEMWSFVGDKQNKQWKELALDADTREIVSVFIGHRSRQSAKQLWQSLPAVTLQCAISYTDFWSAYEQVLPSKRHPCRGQGNGQHKLN